MKDYISKGWNKDKLALEMTSMFEWAARYHVRLTCLEFGVYRPHVDVQARANWLHDMREIFESHHVPWAVWEYNEGFGILAPDKDADNIIRTSLGLNLNQAQ
jgi:hypothetical protein